MRTNTKPVNVRARKPEERSSKSLSRLTVYVGAELGKQIATHPEVNWSEVVRNAVKHHLDMLEPKAQWFPTNQST